VNTNPKTRQKNEAGEPRSRAVRAALISTLILGAIVAAYAMWPEGKDDRAAVATAQVQRGPLVITVAESGTIQNRERAVVKSEVEGAATILFLTPEGTNVRKDDLLVELDASQLADNKTQQQITVLNSEAAFIRAREDLAVTRSQTDSDIAKAKLAYKFAQQDLTKYTEGEYPRELQQAESEIKIAKEELERANDKLNWSKRLAEQGYVTRTELQADELSAQRANINLDLANSAKELLETYTHQRQLDQLRSDLEQAEEAFERTKRKATADMVQAEAELKAKESEFERQKSKLEKTDDQIAKCRILAPVGGMVVYATTGQGSRWRNAEPLAEGQVVRERQELIYLPTDATMMVAIKVHEASLQKVRLGMPVRVTVDALPGKVFWGRVSKIALLPDAMSAWLNPDLTVYETEIQIQNDANELRAGLTCLAEIIVAQYPEALFVPVQSVVRVAGKTVVYAPGPKGPETQEVQVGLDNNRVIRIIDGLAEGDAVLLAPPLAASTMHEESVSTLTEIPQAKAPAAPAKTQAAEESEAAEPAVDLGKIRDMSPEERRRAFENLTPEQKEQLRKKAGGKGGGRLPTAKDES